MEFTQWLPFLAASGLKGTVLLGVAALVALRLRQGSAAARHLVWHGALLGALCVPLVSLVAPRWEVLPPLSIVGTAAESSLAPAPAHREPVEVAAPVVDGNAGREDVATGQSAGAAVVQPPGGGAGPLLPRLPLGTLLLVVWAAGAVLVLGRLALGTAVVRWFAWRGQPVEATSWASLNETMSFAVGLGHPVRLLKSARVATPMTFGVLNPVVLLPADADEWPEDRRRVVLLHELAHVRRLDSLTNIYATLACAVYWFNPFIWLAARRLRAESERACDDWVLRAGMRASTYAEHLLDMVKTLGRLPTPAAALPMAQRSTFEGRLLAILEPGMNRNGTRRGQAVLLVAAIAVLVLPLAAMSNAAAVPQPASPAATGGAAVDLNVGAYDRHSTEPVVSADVSVSAAADTEVEQERNVDTGTPEAAEARLSPAALGALVAAVSDEVVEVRLESVKALGQAGDPRAIAALSAALRGDQDAEVRRTSAWALGQIGDSAGVPALGEAVRNDRAVEVRRMAAWALGEIGESAGVPALTAALRDSDAEVRHTAVWALGEIGDESAVEPLVNLLRDSEAEVRNQAAWALGEIGSERAVPGLGGLVGDANVDVRETATWALGEIGDEAAIPALESALKDSDASVRESAAWALGELGESPASGALLEALRDSNVEVRRTVVWALGEIEDPGSAAALRPVLQDTDSEVKRGALRALARIGDEAAYAALAELLKDPDATVRRDAAAALGGGGHWVDPRPRPRPQPRPRPDGE